MFRTEQNWLPAASYVEPVAVPGGEPDASPQVQLCFSAAWLPYVLGCLAQLTQPTTWDTTDPPTLQTALDRSQGLIELFGAAGACEVLAMRISACELQFSVDGGATWTTVTAWDTYTQTCLPPPPPPNPIGTPTSQYACNIATFLATQLLQGSLVSVVHSFDTAATTTAAVAALIALVPGWGTELSAIIDAGTGLFLLVTSGTRSDFNTAAGSATLLKALQCAIFSSINAAGAVTTGNFAAVAAAIHAIGYTPADVQNAIDSYVNTLGAAGLMQAQLTGGVYVGDCSTCSAPWCWTIDFTVSQGGSEQYAAEVRGGTNVDIWSSGYGWHSAGFNIGGDGFSEAGMQISFPSAHVTSVDFVYDANVTSGGQGRVAFAAVSRGGSDVATLTLTAAAVAGDQTAHLVVGASAGIVGIVVRTNQNTDAQVIKSVTIRGTGTSPFGSSNCT